MFSISVNSHLVVVTYSDTLDTQHGTINTNNLILKRKKKALFYKL